METSQALTKKKTPELLIILEACAFSTRMHAGQKRKYTDEPYVLHCLEVATIVAGANGNTVMVAAALLHDVVEDTSATIAEIKQLFGTEISEAVAWLTDASTTADGNRATRKAIDRDHLAKAPADIKTVKLADIICNTRSIVEYGGDFKKVYLSEMEALLEVLIEGDSALWHQAKKEVNRGLVDINSQL